MLAQYGEHCVAQKKCTELGRFKRASASLDNEKRPGRPSTSQKDNHRIDVESPIKENRRITVSEIALTLGISYASVTWGIHAFLHKRKCFFADENRRLANRYTTCVEKKG
jgi:hypothetical protein